MGGIRNYQGKEMTVVKSNNITSPKINQNHKTIIITSHSRRPGDECLKVIFWLSEINSEIRTLKTFFYAGGKIHTHAHTHTPTLLRM